MKALALILTKSLKNHLSYLCPDLSLGTWEHPLLLTFSWSHISLESLEGQAADFQALRFGGCWDGDRVWALKSDGCGLESSWPLINYL